MFSLGYAGIRSSTRFVVALTTEPKQSRRAKARGVQQGSTVRISEDMVRMDFKLEIGYTFCTRIQSDTVFKCVLTFFQLQD